MMRNMRMGVPALFKGGTKHLSGVQQAVLSNIEACEGLSKITRTSMGPNGMNKMVINHLERLFVTSDAATILREMEIDHAAAKMLVMAAEMQEKEIGDGSNFVIMFAGALLSKAADLIDMGLPLSEIVGGYNIASKKAFELFNDLAVRDLLKEELNEKNVAEGIRTCISSKQFGCEDFLAPLVARACLSVMPKNTYNFNVDDVRICKILGGDLEQSTVVKGMIVTHGPQGIVKKMEDCKVAVFSCGLDIESTETKGNVLINNADELLNYSEGEEKALKNLIKSIADAGVNVIITGESIGEMAKHFIDKYGILILRTTSKFELRRLARLCKANIIVKLGTPLEQDLGRCSKVFLKEIGQYQTTIFEHDEKDDSQVVSILVRASTNNVLNDIERAIDDGVNVVKALGRDGRLIAGGGAFDIEIARKLQNFASKQSGLEQYAIKAFAEAFEVVPRTLAENSGLTAIDIISQLYAAHEAGNTNDGLDVSEKKVVNMIDQKVFDHLATKENALKLSVNTSLTILRVDQIIRSKPAGGPKLPNKGGDWDQD